MRYVAPALTLALLALLVACSDPDRPAATATSYPSGPTPRPTPTPAPTPLSRVTRIPIHWLPGPVVIDLANATEPADPFAPVLRENLKSTPDLGPNDWSIYAADLSGSVRQLVATHRMADTPTWDAAGIHLPFLSAKDVPVAGKAVPMEWGGVIDVDPGAGPLAERFAAFPSDFGQVATSEPPFNWLSRLEDGRRNDTYALALFKSASGPGAATGALIQVAPDGANKLLQGLPALDSAQVLAGGAVIEAQRTAGRNGSPPAFIYLIPPTDGDAIVIENAVGWDAESVRGALQAMVQAPNNRALFLLRTGRLDCCDAVLFDAATFGVRRIATVPESPRVSWQWSAPADGDKVNQVKIANVLLDVTTGQVSSPAPSQTPVAPPAVTIQDYKSPGGRYVVRMTTSGAIMPCRKITVIDTVTGTEATASDSLPKQCLSGYGGGSSQWWDETHLGISISCNSEGQATKVVLIDAVAAETSALSPGCARGESQNISPDGRYVLVNGEKLWLYTSSGRLISTWDPPAGISVWGATWSADSHRFAFVTGPSNCGICRL